MAITMKKQKPLTAVAGEPCPVCGQRVPSPENRFSTGGFGAVPVAVREIDAPLERDGETWHRVLSYVREGNSVEHIAEHMALTLEQVQAVADDYQRSV